MVVVIVLDTEADKSRTDVAEKIDKDAACKMEKMTRNEARIPRTEGSFSKLLSGDKKNNKLRVGDLIIVYLSL